MIGVDCKSFPTRFYVTITWHEQRNRRRDEHMPGDKFGGRLIRQFRVMFCQRGF